MHVEYINPFLTATISVFDTMLQCPLTRAETILEKVDRSLRTMSSAASSAFPARRRAPSCSVLAGRLC